MKHLSEPEIVSAIPGVWHEFANLFPMMEGESLKELERDIAENGVMEPVVQFEGKILDGRNRYFVAHGLGLTVPVAQFLGTAAEALDFVISHNLHRRHLTDSQRASVAAKLANMTHGGDRKSDQAANRRLDRVSSEEAAERLNVSERNVERARVVQSKGTPELAAALDRGEVAVSAAAAVATLPPEEQAEIVVLGPKAIRAKAREVREAKRKPAAEPAAPSDDHADLRREFRKLTPEAQEDDWIALREETDRLRKTVADQKAEIADLKEKLAEATADNQGAVIGKLQKQISTIRYARDEALLAAKRMEYRLKKAEGERDAVQRESEDMMIPLGPQ